MPEIDPARYDRDEWTRSRPQAAAARPNLPIVFISSYADPAGIGGDGRA
jgi:hypothetical protein